MSSVAVGVATDRNVNAKRQKKIKDKKNNLFDSLFLPSAVAGSAAMSLRQ